MEAGGKGVLKLNLPEDWRKAGVLYLTAFDPAGKEVWTWSWGIRNGCESCHQYVKSESKKNSEISFTEGQEELLVKVDGLKLSFSKKTGDLAKVEKDGRSISMEKGPRPIVGDNKLGEFNHWRKNDDIFVEAIYEEGLDYAKWKIYPSGWVRLDYQYELDGQFDLMGITFDYPENKNGKDEMGRQRAISSMEKQNKRWIAGFLEQ